MLTLWPLLLRNIISTTLDFHGTKGVTAVLCCCRNKHIFPASRWETYNPEDEYETYTTHGAEIN